MEVRGSEVTRGAPAAPPAPRKRWNHDTAYYGLVLRSVPPGSRDLLDVGCADGRLARELSGPGRHVLGLDARAELVAAARADHAGVAGLEFVEGDFLAAELPLDGFDFVCFVASLHHMDQAEAVAKAERLLRPGGRLVVIGLARAATPAEKLVDAVCKPVAWFNDQRPEFDDSDGVPGAEPGLGWHETRQLLLGALPGARFRRRLYFRYSLVWTKAR